MTYPVAIKRYKMGRYILNVESTASAIKTPHKSKSEGIRAYAHREKRKNLTYRSKLTKYREERSRKGNLITVCIMLIILSANVIYTQLENLTTRTFLIINEDVVGVHPQMTSTATLVETDGEAEGIKLSAYPTVEDKIRAIAKEQNFRWPDYLVKLARCESSLDPNAINTNKNGTSDKGLFQINDVHGLSDEFRYDIRQATIWTINKINAGQQRIWMCDKILKNNKKQ